ncbi:hypothetical protein QWZ08_13370 [Ferruginibacter paludis]|uniref:hypothetical protein n=1 Tax=Ferruginibacter paludis TaxID=1310417 RepID=UPI0025B547B9|nr:hypothetical protein [Ferruginibacter paludis]MDN3656628.1 hypothetical protein [Ferruginibacter paludis]
MKKLFVLAGCIVFVQLCFSQGLHKTDAVFLQQKEDSLKTYAKDMIQAINPQNRFKADSLFTKMFVRALKTNGSFSYPFDSLETISKLYPPDSSFRIFTWQMVISDNVIRQHGAIQMKTTDGSLKLFPLIDKSDVTDNISDTVGDNRGWIGAVYYRMIETRSANQNFYTLLGYDENNIRSNRKIIEVLSFKDGEPVFGGRYFSFDNDAVKQPAVSRYIMEYKKSTGPRLTYDADLDMIVFEHLESESNEPKKKWTLIPDGDYEGFKWKNGQWIHVEKVFNQITPEGKEPVPSPLRETQGNLEEDKLQDSPGEKAAAAGTPASVKKPKVVKKKVKPEN